MREYTVVETDWRSEVMRLAHIRRVVFIEEQGVPEALEWDADDETAAHFLALDSQGEPVGCARLLPDGHVGRMAVLRGRRRHGIGRALLARVERAARARGQRLLRLSAQTHAAGFYARAGFERVGDEYEEAGIPHVAMHKTLD